MIGFYNTASWLFYSIQIFIWSFSPKRKSVNEKLTKLQLIICCKYLGTDLGIKTGSVTAGADATEYVRIFSADIQYTYVIKEQKHVQVQCVRIPSSRDWIGFDVEI